MPGKGFPYQINMLLEEEMKAKIKQELTDEVLKDIQKTIGGKIKD